MNAIAKPVLLPVTGDHGLDAAIPYAAAQANLRRSGVHLVHVMHPGIGPGDSVELRLLDGELRQVSADLLERTADAVRKFVDEDVPVSTELVHGLVVPALVECSKEADLVVLQHRRRSVITRVASHSVTTGLAARAHAPVVSVPEFWQPGLGPVVVGVEDPQSSYEVVRLGLHEARLAGSAARLVQCWWISQMYDDIVFGDRSGVEHSNRLHHHLETDLAPLLEEFAEVPVQLVVTHQPPADALVGESRHASLVVVGRHHPSMPLGSHLGSIARTVVREGKCPVLVVEPRA